MDVPGTLKKHNPQMYYMKLICDAMYYLGFGSCWYEPRIKSVVRTRIYLVWAVLSNFYTAAVIFNVFLANFRKDLSEQEQNDVRQFTLAHSTILCKIVFNYICRKDIRIVLERLLERSTFVSAELDKECVKRFVTLCAVFASVTYATVLFSTFDGIRVHLSEGIPIRTEVVYYPSSSDSGLAVNILRFFIMFHWFYAVTIMVVIDCLCIHSLVIVGYKFKYLQAYFESLRQKILQDMGKKSRKDIKEQYKRGFVVGIEMHENALWCARNVQSALGSLYSVQIFETVILLVMCLLNVVQVERNLVFVLANFAYIVGLILITGAYMTTSGDITYEASQVSQAIYNSGWELVGAGRDVRLLATLALQRSQVSVYMCAFGILTMSYDNFITVIRSSYSFFAVMY